MTTIFLHGGGYHPAACNATFGRFAREALEGRDGPIVLVVAAPDDDERQATVQRLAPVFQEVGVPETRLLPLFVAPPAPLTRLALDQTGPSGVFVCGGLTPLYQASLCGDVGWVSLLRERGIPYAGFSAGASIAAQQAIVGGWLAERGGIERPIVDQATGEDLDRLDVRPGLGLVPFAVEVHAAQWGTLSRLVHAVDLGLVGSGWALDEDTMLVVDEGELHVFGLGHACFVQRTVDGGLTIAVHTAGA